MISSSHSITIPQDFKDSKDYSRLRRIPGEVFSAEKDLQQVMREVQGLSVLANKIGAARTKEPYQVSPASLKRHPSLLVNHQECEHGSWRLLKNLLNRTGWSP